MTHITPNRTSLITSAPTAYKNAVILLLCQRCSSPFPTIKTEREKLQVELFLGGSSALRHRVPAIWGHTERFHGGLCKERFPLFANKGVSMPCFPLGEGCKVARSTVGRSAVVCIAFYMQLPNYVISCMGTLHGVSIW